MVELGSRLLALDPEVVPGLLHLYLLRLYLCAQQRLLLLHPGFPVGIRREYYCHLHISMSLNRQRLYPNLQVQPNQSLHPSLQLVRLVGAESHWCGRNWCIGLVRRDGNYWHPWGNIYG